MLQRNVSRYATWLIVAAAAGLGACTSTTAPCNSNCTPPPPVTPPVNLAFVSGPTEGVVGDTLPEAVIIKATNTDGTPAVGASIEFSLSNGGAIENHTVAADANGEATPGKWLLGTRDGNQRLVVQSSGVPLTVNVTAAAGPFFDLDASPGMAGVWPTDSVIPVTNTWVATDKFNNRVGAGIAVTFTALDGSTLQGHGTTQASVSEDNGDVPAAPWVMPASEGPKRLVASFLVDGLPKADTLTVEAVTPP